MRREGRYSRKGKSIFEGEEIMRISVLGSDGERDSRRG